MTAATSSLPACLLAETNVIQPPHLEGDPTLATEILPGPPSVASIRQPAKKGDPKRPPVPLSYLPLYDPGTTYSGLIGGTSMATLDDSGSRRKRARVDSRFSSRSQRASARGLTNPLLPNVVNSAEDEPTTTSQPMLESIMIPASNGEDIPSTPHTSSVQIAEENPVKNKVGRPKKTEQLGVTKEKVVVPVKEEYLPMQLSDVTPRNDDHCSSCTSTGALVYCDGCPRAFHLWCLDPPMEASELSDGDRWFCPRCGAADAPSLRLQPSFLSPLLHQVHNSIPKEFQLPEEIRSYFRDVAMAPNGAYIDSSTIKPFRIGRHGVGAEEREPYRLRDGKGLCTLCFGCGKSTLPDELMPSTSSFTDTRSHQWKSMISCDYCSLHWHLDCLDPPLTTMPPFGRKWKCPNHASNIVPKRRIPRNNTVIKDITRSNQYNNGNIEVINIEDSTFSQERLPADDVLINGTRYRVPERAIILDFWTKAQHPLFKRPPRIDQVSMSSSSPLTSLTSLDDDDGDDEQIVGDDTLAVAQMLCNMQKVIPRNMPKVENPSHPRIVKDIAVQTDTVTLHTHSSEGILSNGINEKLPGRSRLRSSNVFGKGGESSPSRRSPKPSSNGKSQEHITRRRASRGNISAIDGLQTDLPVDSTSYNISESSIHGTPGSRDAKSTSLKIRIPVLTSKMLPPSDRSNDEILLKDPIGTNKDFESSIRPLSSRPIRTTRMKPAKPPPVVFPDSSTSHSELTSIEDDSRNNSDVIGKGADDDDSDFNVEPVIPSCAPSFNLHTRGKGLTINPDDNPRKKRRMPSLSFGQNEGSSSVANVSPMINISSSSRTSSRGRRPKRTAQGRKLKAPKQPSELQEFNSISDPLTGDEESDLMSGSFNSTSLGQSAIPIASLS